MALETGTYISDLVTTNPTISDNVSQGDDHLRLIKSTLKTTFPNVTGAVTPTHTVLNYVDIGSSLTTLLAAKVGWQVTSTSSNTSISNSYRLQLIIATGGTPVFSLPAGSTIGDAILFLIKTQGGASLTVQAVSSEILNNTTNGTYTLNGNAGNRMALCVRTAANEWVAGAIV